MRADLADIWIAATGCGKFGQLGSQNWFGFFTPVVTTNEDKDEVRFETCVIFSFTIKNHPDNLIIHKETIRTDLRWGIFWPHCHTFSTRLVSDQANIWTFRYCLWRFALQHIYIKTVKWSDIEQTCVSDTNLCFRLKTVFQKKVFQAPKCVSVNKICCGRQSVFQNQTVFRQ